MTVFYYLVIASEFLAAVLATIYFRKYQSTGLRIVMPLLWYILINEALGQFAFAFTKTGYLLYNIYDFLIGSTILFITASQMQNTKRKNIVRSFLIICTISFLINGLQINLFKESFTFAPVISAILIVLGLLYYLIELLKSDKIINVGRDLFLWISIGFLIFFLAYPVLLFARNYFTLESPSLVQSLNMIHYVVAMLTYLVIAFGFYYGEKREPITSTSKQLKKMQ